MVMRGPQFNNYVFHRQLVPLYHGEPQTSDSWSRLITVGWQALMHGQSTCLLLPPSFIFKYAANLMGHKNIGDSTIVLSQCGQVLFPAFFEVSDFSNVGFLQLCTFPGKLRISKMEFDYFTDARNDQINTDVISDADIDDSISNPDYPGEDYDSVIT
jgi:hypothetical protein